MRGKLQLREEFRTSHACAPVSVVEAALKLSVEVFKKSRSVRYIRHFIARPGYHCLCARGRSSQLIPLSGLQSSAVRGSVSHFYAHDTRVRFSTVSVVRSLFWLLNLFSLFRVIRLTDRRPERQPDRISALILSPRKAIVLKIRACYDSQQSAR